MTEDKDCRGRRDRGAAAAGRLGTYTVFGSEATTLLESEMFREKASLDPHCEKYSLGLGAPLGSTKYEMGNGEAELWPKLLRAEYPAEVQGALLTTIS
jgi:hypothetical protein